MTNSLEQDPVERLAAYRPTRTQLDAEWTGAHRAAVRTRVMASPQRARLSWRPARGRGVLNASVLTAAAILALFAGVLIVVVRPGHTGGDATSLPGGAPPTPLSLSATQNTTKVGTDQYARRTMTVYDISANGTATTHQQGTVWASPDGSTFFSGNLSALGCTHFSVPVPASFEQPTSEFFDDMPTSTAALERYMRAQVSGSSSQDEALFVATGDMLRNTDLLASSQLRVAIVNVLSGISGITVHTDTTDYLGRAAVRVDWVNQALRPGVVSSLYFDPASFQLLEERDGPSGASTTYDGPSPAYTAQAADQDPTSEQLANPSSITVMSSETVVDAVPYDVESCPGS